MNVVKAKYNAWTTRLQVCVLDSYGTDQLRWYKWTLEGISMHASKRIGRRQGTKLLLGKKSDDTLNGFCRIFP